LNVQGSGTDTIANQQWCVVHTKPGKEDIALDNLNNMGFKSYLPKVMSSNTKRKKLVALFPRYLFLNTNIEDTNWMAVNSTNGISRIINQSGKIAVVPERIIEEVKIVESRAQGENPTRFKVGDVVQIDADSAFGGCIGNIERYSSKDRVILLLSVLEKKMKFEIDEDLLYPVDNPVATC